MKNFPLYLSLLFILTCAKEDSQAPNTPPTQIVKQYALTASAGDGGSVTGGGTFASGTQVSLTQHQVQDIVLVDGLMGQQRIHLQLL